MINSNFLVTPLVSGIGMWLVELPKAKKFPPFCLIFRLIKEIIVMAR